jgi:nucleoside phosphorylase
MAVEWRDTLQILLDQFAAGAARSTGLNHLFVEVAEHERDRMQGPSWFAPFPSRVRIVDGSARYQKWDVSRFSGLPQVSPSFREIRSQEDLSEIDPSRVISDGRGNARAVAVPMKQRRGYFCGKPIDDVLSFESLGNAAAAALAGSNALDSHVFASELSGLFRRPRSDVRYVFGEVQDPPKESVSRGWQAGIWQFEKGVLIDVPISESTPDVSHWLLFLHRLGWRGIEGTGLRAKRIAWNDSMEIDFDLLGADWSNHSGFLAKELSTISRDSFYSVIGSKEVPLDVNLASAFAIQLLLAESSAQETSTLPEASETVDYSNEEWQRSQLPQVRVVSHAECAGIFQPRIGLLVATDVERIAALKRMYPPSVEDAVLQVFEGNNTFFLGRLGITDVVLCMAAMGSSGRDASTLVTAEMVQSWNLLAVIMTGIAFGKDPVRQRIGEVLISDRIIPYEPQRIGQVSVEHRGVVHAARPLLLNRFRNVLGWSFRCPNGHECGMQVGAILSGDKLVDSLEFKKQLLLAHPIAIGGEMEGTGFAAAAERANCEWIVAKAICDWGDGKKSKLHQEFAAAAAVSLIEHVLNQRGALDALH